MMCDCVSPLFRIPVCIFGPYEPEEAAALRGAAMEAVDVECGAVLAIDWNSFVFIRRLASPLVNVIADFLDEYLPAVLCTNHFTIKPHP